MTNPVASLAALLRTHPMFVVIYDDTASPTQQERDECYTKQLQQRADELAEWLLARGVQYAPPPQNPDGVCGPTGGNTTPLSDIAAMAVDLGAPDLSSTFRKGRGAAQGLGEPPVGNVVNLTRLIHEAESRWSAFAEHGLTCAEFTAIELHRQGVRAGHPEGTPT